jgi:hypothetical protein
MKWIQRFTNPSILYLYLINPGIHRIEALSKLTDQPWYASLEMPVPSQGHYGFHSFPVVD